VARDHVNQLLGQIEVETKRVTLISYDAAVRLCILLADRLQQYAEQLARGPARAALALS
jgi:hypothetical protein